MGRQHWKASPGAKNYASSVCTAESSTDAHHGIGTVPAWPSVPTPQLQRSWSVLPTPAPADLAAAATLPRGEAGHRAMVDSTVAVP